MSATEDRCAECGLGSSTGVPLTAVRGVGDAAPAVAAPLGDALDDDMAMLLANMRDPSAHFRDATFLPHALDDRWSGLRWLGGSEWNERGTTALVLAHGDEPWNETATQVRVRTALAKTGDTRTDLDYEVAETARAQVDELWRETGVLHDDVRRAAFEGSDPTRPWSEAEIPVDGRPLVFKVLAQDDFWVAHTALDASVVSVSARGWPVDRTGIVVVEDLAPYDAGSREIKDRWPG